MVVLANGFEELEAIGTIDILRRGGIDVKVVGLTSKNVKGSRGVKIIAEKKLSEIKNFDVFQGIVLPGGNPGYKNLLKSKKLKDLIKRFFIQGKLIAAICAAPLVLKEAGILDDIKATAYPGVDKKLPNPVPSKVVSDKNVITGRGPGAVFDFALEIVRKVQGKEVADAVRGKLFA